MSENAVSVSPAAAAAGPVTGSPKKTKTTPAVKKPRVKPAHPPTSEMVNNAIKSLKERGGSSMQAIKKYMSANYKIDAEKMSTFIKKYLKSAVIAGTLIQTKGKGASGSFKLAATTKQSAGEATGPAKAKSAKAASKTTKPKTKTSKPKSATKPASSPAKKKTAAAKKSAAKKQSVEKKKATVSKAAKASVKSKSPVKPKKVAKPAAAKKPKVAKKVAKATKSPKKAAAAKKK